MKLLIVESPGKIKTLRKILGADWLLEASIGHTTELAHDGFKNLGFEIQKDQVTTRYVPRTPRGPEVLKRLRSAIRHADQVYLAMDPDREGEAIAWHLVEQLRLKKFARVTYTQITEAAVLAAIGNPRGLDFPLIHAQRARQCLDKLVGFEVSPLLWKTSGGKSAGRVQSATLHMVCERERERLRFVPEDYWTLHSHYDNQLIAQYQPANISQKTEAERIHRVASSEPHVVSKLEERKEKRLPPPPLITSSLQQMASFRLKFSPQHTMKIAQELYEGVGGSGLITYMRTDSVNLSPEFIQEARAWLKQESPDAISEQATLFHSKTPSINSQAAHEAIRPTSAEVTPEKIRTLLSRDQHLLYKLIWERAMASQCKPALLAKTLIEICAEKTLWTARGSRVVDAGYLKFWNNIEEDHFLPQVKVGQILNLQKIKIEKKTTQSPSRCSEAKLIQLMEKNGIGRPSTYASTVMTLKERDYVLLEKDVLTPTALGMATDGVLSLALPDLVDVDFTAQMEKSLDRIADNQLGWEKFLSSWNEDYFRQAMLKAHSKVQNMPRSDGQAKSSYSSKTSKKSKSSSKISFSLFKSQLKKSRQKKKKKTRG